MFKPIFVQAFTIKIIFNVCFFFKCDPWAGTINFIEIRNYIRKKAELSKVNIK